MQIIPLTQGQITILNDNDFQRFGHYQWSALWNKTVKGYYAVRSKSIKYDKKMVYLHREIMNAEKGWLVDHENHDTLDNRRNNLRVCTRSQNMRNRKSASVLNRTGIRGVGWHKLARKWRSQIGVSGKLKHLGLFERKEDAIKASKEARKKYFGSFVGA